MFPAQLFETVQEFLAEALAGFLVRRIAEVNSAAERARFAGRA
jgi:hypothetical protein